MHAVGPALELAAVHAVVHTVLHGVPGVVQVPAVRPAGGLTAPAAQLALTLVCLISLLVTWEVLLPLLLLITLFQINDSQLSTQNPFTP